MTSILKSMIFAITFLQVHYIYQSDAHGRMLEPPARNILWRFGFQAPPNYNDNELFCGGIGGITRNDGKCGVCGDPYDGDRIHETGHYMALNKTTRNYFPGSSIDLMIEIVANHGGRFNFEICWRDSWDQIETEECFEKLRLSGANETLDKDLDEDAKNYELDPASGIGIYTMSINLPQNKTCEHCILRWHWKSANNWGVCEDGTEAIGCGYQEIYRNCADISVKRDGAGIGLGFNKRR